MGFYLLEGLFCRQSGDYPHDDDDDDDDDRI